jgi:RecA/RadA recombinase
MAKSLKAFLQKTYPDAMDTDIISEVRYLNTEIPTVNYVISGKPLTGGLPLTGKITIMYGPEGCGKTSFVVHMIARAQRASIDVVYIDTERSITRPRLEQFGVNVEELNYLTPETMEECFDIIEAVCREKMASGDREPVLIVWDSIAMTPTSDEINRTSEDVEIASQARVLTRNLRRIRGKIKRIEASLLLVNQARANQARFGDLFTMPGGYALHHAADVILRVNRVKPDESGQGIKISTPIKNRLFRPFQSTTLRFEYTDGFTKENIVDAFCDFLKDIEILGTAGPYCYLETDVQRIAKSEGIDSREAVKKADKFFKKDFVKRLIEDQDYYSEMLRVAEEYVNTNIAKVSQILLDKELTEEELKSIDGESGGVIQ